MASTKLMETKDGRKYYRIQVRMGRGSSPMETRWYIPDGWSAKSIERGLIKASQEFESKVKAGEIISRKQCKAIEESAKAEAEKIKTVEQYINKVFMPELSITCSENTRTSYQGNFNRHIIPALGSMKLPEVTPTQINSLLLSLQASGMKTSTAIKIYTILSSLFKKAYMEDAIERNPMDKVHRPKPRKDELVEAESTKSYTEKDMAFILSVLSQEPLKWRCFVELLIDSGCRRAEALGLCWDAVDLDHGIITIKRTLNYTPTKGVYLDTTKTKKPRMVDISPDVVSLLRKYKASQIATQPTVITMRGKDEPDFVFRQDGSDEPMHPTSPTHYFRMFGKKYGIEDFHPHKLRHTNASISITNGADIASVSERLGHADKSTTLKMYTHADEASKMRAGNVFRNAIGKA